MGWPPYPLTPPGLEWPEVPLPGLPELPELPSFGWPEFTPGQPGPEDLVPDRMTEGHRAVRKKAELAVAGYRYGRDWYEFVDSLRANRLPFIAGGAYGLMFGAPGVDALGQPTDGHGLIHTDIAENANRLWYQSIGLGVAMVNARFYEGLWQGLRDEVMSIPDLLTALSDGSLVSAIGEALDAIADSPRTAFALGQQLGAGMVQPLLAAMDRGDSDTFAFELGRLLGALLLDLLFALFTGGWGFLMKLGEKAFAFTADAVRLIKLLGRRLERGLDQLADTTAQIARQLDPANVPVFGDPWSPAYAGATPGRYVDAPQTPAWWKLADDADAPDLTGTGAGTRGTGGAGTGGTGTGGTRRASDGAGARGPGDGPDAPDPAGLADAGGGPRNRPALGAAAGSGLAATGRAADAQRAWSLGDGLKASRAAMARQRNAPDMPDARWVARALDPTIGNIPPVHGPFLASVLNSGGRVIPAYQDIWHILMRARSHAEKGGISRVDLAVLDGVRHADIPGLPAHLQIGQRQVRTHLSGILLPRTVSRAAMPNYNADRVWRRMRKELAALREATGLDIETMNALHAWGPGFGDETIAGMALGPAWVNQKAQAGAIRNSVLGWDSARDARRIDAGPYASEVMRSHRTTAGAEGVLIDHALTNREAAGRLGQSVSALDVYTLTWGDELLGTPLFREAGSRGMKVKPQDFLHSVEYHMRTYDLVDGVLEPRPDLAMRFRLALDPPPDTPGLTVTVLDPLQPHATGVTTRIEKDFLAPP